MTKENETKDKKTVILQAATTVLTKRGLQALSFERIATESGLSRQLIRYYYRDFDTLIVELCDFLANGYREILVKGIVEIAQVERLDFFLDFFFGLRDDYPMPDNLEAYDSLVAYAVGSEELKDRMCAQYKTLGQVVAHELAIAHPELDGQACEELSYIFASMMHAHWSFVATLGYSSQHNLLTRKALSRLIASYVQDPTHTPGVDMPWSREP